MTTESLASGMDATKIGARFDRIPVATRKHWVILWMLGALGIFDAFDLAAFGYTAPAIRQDLGLSLSPFHPLLEGETGWPTGAVRRQGPRRRRSGATHHTGAWRSPLQPILCAQRTLGRRYQTSIACTDP